MAEFLRLAGSRIALGVIYLYRAVLRPVLPTSCKYYPSCSHYAEEAIRLHGALKGSWMALRRIRRCHPLAEGGYDPVPERMKAGG